MSITEEEKNIFFWVKTTKENGNVMKKEKFVKQCVIPNQIIQSHSTFNSVL